MSFLFDQDAIVVVVIIILLLSKRCLVYADRQKKFIFRIHCNHSKIDDDNSHTFIRNCTLRHWLLSHLHCTHFAAPGESTQSHSQLVTY